jgi:hypothetical protein
MILPCVVADPDAIFAANPDLDVEIRLCFACRVWIASDPNPDVPVCDCPNCGTAPLSRNPADYS